MNIESTKLQDSTQPPLLQNGCYVQCGDNLELLKSQPNESVNMIYCDILYGTGRNFGDYQDLKPIRSEIESHYLPRLTEMHRVLSNTGTIYLQMDLRIVHWIRIMMDDIFGYDNFRNQIVVKFNIGGRGKNEFAKKHDYLVVYTKSDIFTFNDLDIRIPYRSVISKKQDRPNITAEKLALGTIPTNVWDDIPSGLKVKKDTNYATEKHKKLLERIIKASSNEGDVVADYYLGSGTTAKVCQELNRNFIGCDLNPKAIEITKVRLNGGQ
jgi:site-specific DNA-methyltransferase (adenine-specific)